MLEINTFFLDKRGENEGNLEDGVDCVPESPELTPLLRNYPKGFKSPVKVTTIECLVQLFSVSFS